jgi:hypothetical protein
MLKHPDAFYIRLGARFEKARSPIDASRVMTDIRAALSKEQPDALPEARRLIERGRVDAR